MLWCEHLCGSTTIVIIMKNPTLCSYALLLSIVCSASCKAVSELKDGVEEHVEASTPLEISGKSDEVKLDEKAAVPDHVTSQTRSDRSTEAASDKSGVDVESKKDKEAEVNSKTAVDIKDKSAEIANVEDKVSDVNDAAEETSGERSGLNHAQLENNDDLSIRTLNKDATKVNEKSVDDPTYVSRETTRSMSYDTQDMFLDQKARSAKNSDENFEIQAKSDLEAINAESLGSRRSYSGTPGSSGFVNSGRSGQMFEDFPLSLPSPNPAMFNKISNEDLIQPNTYFDPVSSSEFKPLEQLNSNPFANSYPYAFQPTTPTPAEMNRYQEIGPLPKMVQPLENLHKPIDRFISENFRPLPPLHSSPLNKTLHFRSSDLFLLDLTHFLLNLHAILKDAPTVLRSE